MVIIIINESFFEAHAQSKFNKLFMLVQTGKQNHQRCRHASNAFSLDFSCLNLMKSLRTSRFFDLVFCDSPVFCHQK